MIAVFVSFCSRAFRRMERSNCSIGWASELTSTNAKKIAIRNPTPSVISTVLLLSKTAQHLHVDAVIDNRHPSFDIQLFYFPTEVAQGAGGTRFVPGTHLRYTRAEGVARYQHIVGEEHFSGPAGTLLVFHQGLWHAGQPNPSDNARWMYKIRLNPNQPQKLLWNTDDLQALQNDARDHTFAHMRTDSVAHILRTMLPWQQGHELRYEQMQRTKLWRYLTDDENFDVDYYHTRMETRGAANEAISR